MAFLALSLVSCSFDRAIRMTALPTLPAEWTGIGATEDITFKRITEGNLGREAWVQMPGTFSPLLLQALLDRLHCQSELTVGAKKASANGGTDNA
jgi:hypothetical protein